MNLAELQENAIRHGFSHQFVYESGGLRCDGTGPVYDPADLKIVHSNSVDAGTDPGDDATLYMIEASDGTKGMMIIPSSFHTDPVKAQLIDDLRRNSH